MKHLECTKGFRGDQCFGLSLFFAAALAPMAVQAEPPWRNSRLACDYQNLSLFEETEYQMSVDAEHTVGPEVCVVGHWSLVESSYVDTVLEMTIEQGIMYDDISALAEIIIRESGITQSCAGIAMSGKVESRGVEGDIEMTMQGPTMTLLRFNRELTETAVGKLARASLYRSTVLIDGMSGVSAVTIAGNTYRTDIDTGFSVFAVESHVVCSGNRMSITSFPEGIDHGIEHEYVRVP